MYLTILVLDPEANPTNSEVAITTPALYAG
jgi:hypothetical protein